MGKGQTSIMSGDKKPAIRIRGDELSIMFEELEVLRIRANSLMKDHYSNLNVVSDLCLKNLCELLLSNEALGDYYDTVFPDIHPEKEYLLDAQILGKIGRVVVVLQEIKEDLKKSNIFLETQ